MEAHESVGGVPESVWKKVQAVKQGGGGLDELREKVGWARGAASCRQNSSHVFCSRLALKCGSNRRVSLISSL